MDAVDGDSRDLAKLGYVQRLDRRLGSFAAFAISYGFVAVFTAVTALFFFGFAAAGPGFVWGYPLAAIPTMLVCLCLAELAGAGPAGWPPLLRDLHSPSRGRPAARTLGKS